VIRRGDLRELALGLGTALIVVGAYFTLAETPPLRITEGQALDIRFRLRGVEAPGPDVAIVQIDDRSIAEHGRWPWSRRAFAELVATLGAAKPKVIAFDLLFSEPQDSVPLPSLGALRKAIEGLAADDAAGALDAIREQLGAVAIDFDPDGSFADALADAPSTALAFSFVFHADDDPARRTAYAPSRSVTAAAYSRTTVVAADTAPSLALRADDIMAPVNRLAKAATSVAHVNVALDAGGVARYEYPVLAYQGLYYPSLAIEATRLFLDVDRADVEVVFNRGIRLGPIWVPTDDAMRLIVNYHGPNGLIPIYSYADVMAGRVPARAFAGKLVLVGASAIGVADRFVTPFSPNLSGTEQVATIVDSILARRFIERRQAFWIANAAIAPARGALLGVLAARLSSYVFNLAALVLGVVIAAVNHVLLIRAGLWLNLTLPLAAVVIAYSALTIHRYLIQERRAKEIRTAFSHYIHPDLVHVLASHPERLVLGGEMRVTTVLFADIRGFTGIAQQFRSDPSGLTRLLNRYLTPMSDIILRRHGTIDKYIGDCIMAFWNAPLDDPDHADHAFASALDMIAALGGLNDALESERSDGPRVAIRVGIGINTGECCVGNMGSERRFDYSALGDAVNLASRFEGQTKFYGLDVLVGEETRARIRHLATLKVDRIAVSGKTEPVLVHALLGDAALAADPAYRAHAARHGALLAAFRSQRWAEAEGLLAGCRAYDPRLAGLYDLYAERLRRYAEAPPGADWDGVFVALSK